MPNYCLILMSHGKFAVECVKSMEMLVGEYSHVGALSLDIGEGADALEGRLVAMIEALHGPEKDHIVILTDIMGGTPGRIALTVASRMEQAVVLCGFNLPMVIELVIQEDIDDAYIGELVEKGKDAVKNLTAVMNTYQEGSLEEEADL